MSKSLGNLITIKEALERYSADALRIFVLMSHYRSPLTYSEEAIEAVEEGGAERLLRVVSRDDNTGGEGEALAAEPYRSQFIEAMDDDFNTAQAMSVLFDLARAINQAGDSGAGFTKAKEVLIELARVLGLKLEAFEGPDPETQRRVDALIKERNEFRKTKQWQHADEIRAELTGMGVILEDTPEGTKSVWKRKREPA